MSRRYRERLAASSGVSSSRAFESDFGHRILEKYGWQKGQGLGRLGNGRAECIQAERREAGRGLGAEKRKAEGDHWDNWWADCFDSVARRLSVGAASPAAASSCASDSSSEEDEKVGAAAGKFRRVVRQEKPF